MRYSLEIQSYFSLLWEQILIFGIQDLLQINVLRKKYVEVIQKAVDTSLLPKDRFTIHTCLGSDKLYVPAIVNITIEKAAKDLGLSTSLRFIEKCGILWESMFNGR